MFDDDPWQIRVALQYQARDDAKQVRWLLIDEDAAELVDAFPIKAVAETALIEWLHGGREITLWRATDLVKAAADLENLAQPFGDEGPPGRAPGNRAGRRPATRADRDRELEKAAADAGGTLVTETEDVIQHPDQPVAAKEPVPLFNAADYDREDLAIPKIDGNPIDRIALNFSGSVMLDRSAPLDVGLYNGIHSEATVELSVEAKWGGTAATPATNRDGDLDVIVGRNAPNRVDPHPRRRRTRSRRRHRARQAAARRASRAGVPDDQMKPPPSPRSPNNRVAEEPRTYLRLVKWDEHQHYKGRGIEQTGVDQVLRHDPRQPRPHRADRKLPAPRRHAPPRRRQDREPHPRKRENSRETRPFVTGNRQKIGEDPRESRLHRTRKSHRPRGRSGCSRPVAPRRV